MAVDAHHAGRGRHRAHARPGTDRRHDRHPARRRADPPGRGDRARGAARGWRPSGSASRSSRSTSATAWCGPKAGGAGVTFGELIGDRRFDVEARSQGAAARTRRTYRFVGKPLPRPDVPGKITGRFVYVHDFALPGHAARPGDPAARDRCDAGRTVDESLDRRMSRVRRSCASRISSAWSPRTNGTRSRAARALKAQWSDWPALPGRRGSRTWCGRARCIATRSLVRRATRPPRWPAPSRPPRDVSTGRCRATPRSGRPARSPTFAPTRHRVDRLAGDAPLSHDLREIARPARRARCGSSTSTAPAATA